MKYDAHKRESSLRKTIPIHWPYARPYIFTVVLSVLATLLARFTDAPAICLLLGVMVSCLFAERFSDFLSAVLSVLVFAFLISNPYWRLGASSSVNLRLAAFTFASTFIPDIIRLRNTQIRRKIEELKELIDFFPLHVLLLDQTGRLVVANCGTMPDR
jgi:K+-sensing histidine kinase KdpD